MHAFRAPFRLFVMGLVGLVLMLTAIDVMFVHVLSTAPEGAPEQLTSRGLAQQRGDIILGASLIGSGIILFVSSVVALMKRKPIVDVRDDGLYAQLDGRIPEVLVPWAEVAAVTSGVETDPFDGATREMLIIRVRDMTAVPPALVGAPWRGDELHIAAHDWNRSVTDIALAAQGARNHAMRPPASATPSQAFEPSMMWETKVDVTTEQSAVPDDALGGFSGRENGEMV